MSTEIEKLESELAKLIDEFDPYYQYIENFTQWSKHQSIKEHIVLIKRKIHQLKEEKE